MTDAGVFYEDTVGATVREAGLSLRDLDIPTLEVLEESLLEFSGALVLVTHDRFLLDRVSNRVFGLDGFGSAERFADYRQWEQWQHAQAGLEEPACIKAM